jgi:hypothetical protein
MMQGTMQVFCGCNDKNDMIDALIGGTLVLMLINNKYFPWCKTCDNPVWHYPTSVPALDAAYWAKDKFSKARKEE